MRSFKLFFVLFSLLLAVGVFVHQRAAESRVVFAPGKTYLTSLSASWLDSLDALHSTNRDFLDSLDTLHGDNRDQDSALADTLKARYGFMWETPLPMFPDSTASASDQSTIITISFGTNAYYSSSLFIYGDDDNDPDTTVVRSEAFVPRSISPDSLVLMVKSSAADEDSCCVGVVLRDAAGDIVFEYQRVLNTLADTWQHRGWELDTDLAAEPHSVEYRIRVKNEANQVFIGPCFFKEN